MLSEWISVKERLPENTGPCLVLFAPTFRGARPHITTAWYSVLDGFQTGLPISVREITYWLPLPKPPEED